MGSNPLTPDHESDALTTVPRCPQTGLKKREKRREVKVERLRVRNRKKHTLRVGEREERDC